MLGAYICPISLFRFPLFEEKNEQTGFMGIMSKDMTPTQHIANMNAIVFAVNVN